MKKLVFALFAALALLVSGVAEAGGGHGHGGGGGRGSGGGYGRGGGHGHGGGGGYYRGGGYRGYRGGYRGAYRAGWGGSWGGGWGGGVAIYPRIVIGGPGYWWGSPYRYYGAGYPYYGYGIPYSVPYYQQPVIVQPAQPQVYVEQARPAPQYWHYCEDPKGYYPYVEKCRGEWLQVVPRTESPE